MSDDVRITLTHEEALSLVYFMGDVMQLKDDADFMGQLLYNSSRDDLNRVLGLRERVGEILNERLQRKLAAL